VTVREAGSTLRADAVDYNLDNHNSADIEDTADSTAGSIVVADLPTPGIAAGMNSSACNFDSSSVDMGSALVVDSHKPVEYALSPSGEDTAAGLMMSPGFAFPEKPLRRNLFAPKIGSLGLMQIFQERKQ